MNKIIIAGAVAIALSLSLSSCTSVDTEYTKLDPTGTYVIEHYTKKEKGFTQGWSNGPGKTLDLHPEVNGLNL